MAHFIQFILLASFGLKRFFVLGLSFSWPMTLTVTKVIYMFTQLFENVCKTISLFIKYLKSFEENDKIIREVKRLNKGNSTKTYICSSFTIDRPTPFPSLLLMLYIFS